MFGWKKKVNLEEWSAAMYGAPILHPEKEAETHLAGLTEMLVLQDIRVILESAKIFQETEYYRTREDRYILARDRYRHLLTLKKYARPYSEKNLMKMIKKAERAMEKIESEKATIPKRQLKEITNENLRLLQTTCPHCGAPMKVKRTSLQIIGEYCGSTSVWDINPWQVEYVNAEQVGYEFEQGRNRARREKKRSAHKE